MRLFNRSRSKRWMQRLPRTWIKCNRFSPRFSASTVRRLSTPTASFWLILDVDLTGMPCGKKAEKSTKGYFGQHRSRRGRQQGRVLASQYGEIVVDALYPGNTILLNALPSLIEK